MKCFICLIILHLHCFVPTLFSPRLYNDRFIYVIGGVHCLSGSLFLPQGSIEATTSLMSDTLMNGQQFSALTKSLQGWYCSSVGRTAKHVQGSMGLIPGTELK